MLARIKKSLVWLHRSEQGAEGIEKLLILAAIVVPILIVLIAFRNTISTWVNSQWSTMTTDANQTPATPAAP